MSSAAAWDLAWALIMVLVVFLLATGSKRTWAIGALLIMIPFQMVETRYASSSVLMAYALAAVLLLNGGLKVRMLPALGFIVLAYLVSLSQADRVILSLHVLFVFQFFSCLVVFLLAYNFARLAETTRSVIDVLLAINVLIIVYCGLQLTAEPGEHFVPLGIEQLAFNTNRDPHDPRLIGPFDNPGTTAEYFMMMTFVCAVELMYSEGRRRLLIQLLIGLNLLALVATANRAAFLVLLAMFPVLLLTFRRELGTRRILQYLVGGVAVLAIVSTILITYTGFGIMFERLGSVTETEQGVPTTRVLSWPVAIEKIKQDPWLGEGPFFMFPEAAENLGWMRDDFDNYPHSLYLYLLRTVGIFGLAAVLWFFLQTWRVLYGTLKREGVDAYSSAILRLGLVVIPSFLVLQVTLEFNRPSTMDFAQFIFALMGLLVGVSDRAALNHAGASDR